MLLLDGIQHLLASALGNRLLGLVAPHADGARQGSLWTSGGFLPTLALLLHTLQPFGLELGPLGAHLLDLLLGTLHHGLLLHFLNVAVQCCGVLVVHLSFLRNLGHVAGHDFLQRVDGGAPLVQRPRVVMYDLPQLLQLHSLLLCLHGGILLHVGHGLLRETRLVAPADEVHHQTHHHRDGTCQRCIRMSRQCSPESFGSRNNRIVPEGDELLLHDMGLLDHNKRGERCRRC